MAQRLVTMMTMHTARAFLQLSGELIIFEKGKPASTHTEMEAPRHLNLGKLGATSICCILRRRDGQRDGPQASGSGSIDFLSFSALATNRSDRLSRLT